MRVDESIIQKLLQDSRFKPKKDNQDVQNGNANQGVIGQFFIHNSGVHQETDRPLVERTLRAFRLTDRDRVQVIVISPSQRRGILRTAGSFIHRPTTSIKTKRLSARINRVEREIQELEIGITDKDMTDKEISRELHLLRYNLDVFKRALRAEQARLARLPRTGWIVVERDV